MHIASEATLHLFRHSSFTPCHFHVNNTHWCHTISILKFLTFSPFHFIRSIPGGICLLPCFVSHVFLGFVSKSHNRIFGNLIKQKFDNFETMFSLLYMKIGGKIWAKSRIFYRNIICGDSLHKICYMLMTLILVKFVNRFFFILENKFNNYNSVVKSINLCIKTLCTMAFCFCFF